MLWPLIQRPVETYKGVIEALYTAPPEGGVVGLDEMGPHSAKSFPGQQPVHAEPRPGAEGQVQPAERAQQEIDYGRRGKGSIFGAFRPSTGEALTHPYPSRSAANWADFLGRVEAWIPAEVERVYAIVDNLQAHRAADVLLFALAFARWEFVSQPRYAAYLNLIEPWWKVLKSLALKGRRFETWEEVCQAVEEATGYWNKHRHPFVWGRRRRHRPRRRPGIAAVPGIGDLPDAPLSPFMDPRATSGRSSIARPRPRGPSPAPIVNASPAQHLSGGRDRARFACTRRNASAYGLPLDSFTHTFRTVTRTKAPIFSSFDRIVWHCASANSVPARPSRRNASSST
jgi:hypothetical protein